jgi:hypothetical protein
MRCTGTFGRRKGKAILMLVADTIPPDLETLILCRLQDCPGGQSLRELADFLDASQADTREALYTLLEAHAVIFSNGLWYLKKLTAMAS